MSDQTVQVGTPRCFTSESTCEVQISPKPQLFDVTYNDSCGTQIQIYEPGDYHLTLQCDQHTSTHKLTVEPPPAISKQQQLALPPWLPIESQWAWWLSSASLILVFLLLLSWLALKGYQKYWRKKIVPVAEVWSVSPYLDEIREIKTLFKRGSQRDAAFRLTQVLFKVYHTHPDLHVKHRFYSGYQQVCEHYVDLKFNPSYRGNGQDLDQLISKYESLLLRASHESVRWR